MTKAQRIEAYIKECFETNCINIKEFFSNICEGKAYDIIVHPPYFLWFIRLCVRTNMHV